MTMLQHLRGHPEPEEGTTNNLLLDTSTVLQDEEDTTESTDSTTMGAKRLRIRILNQVTRRYKDLLVHPSADISCFEAIYNHPAVQTAHVRKWDAHLVQQVKRGLSEIQCAIELSSAQEEEEGAYESRILCSFSIEELKATSTAHLARLIAEATSNSMSSPMRVQLVLQCVAKMNKKSFYSSLSSCSTASTASSWSSTTSSSTQTSPTSQARSICSGLQQSGVNPPANPLLCPFNNDEIRIIQEPDEADSRRTNNSSTTRSGASAGISLPPEVVKDVFPYHIVLDEHFCVLQVGNSLAKLLGDEHVVLEQRVIYDFLKVTGPIPQEGAWDWSFLDRLSGMTIFLQPVDEKSTARIKGTVIEISSSPRQVMLALFPDVKNLGELSRMNLTMTDLPLHSCQRDAVLVGEHSASEVKLTHHLDQRHRDLINSMEKQIADRTKELANANRELEEANATLAQHSARQLEHFACMSHEIRTPLNCIVGMASIMVETSDQMTPAHAEAAKLIHGSGELLRAVVNDVLDFARLSSGSFETVVRETNLRDTLDIVAHSIGQRFTDKNVTLRTHYAADLPRMIQTDSRRVQQVLYNLLGNAGKFSKPGNFVDLSVSLVKEALLPGSNSCSAIRFSVKDYGKGIKREDFQKIFEPFSQATQETENGTGLGLSITSKLVERLGGSISVESEEGKFAEFTVDLPYSGESALVESSSVEISDNVEESKAFGKHDSIVLAFPQRKDLKVLYAEDNKVNQKVLRRVLKHLGVPQMDIAENGQQAVDKTASCHYDIIFMDVQMPIMDGVEASRLITARDPDALVVFVTAHALDEFKTKAEQAGGRAFIAKPFRAADIEEFLVSLGVTK